MYLTWVYQVNKWACYPSTHCTWWFTLESGNCELKQVLYITTVWLRNITKSWSCILRVSSTNVSNDPSKMPAGMKSTTGLQVGFLQWAGCHEAIASFTEVSSLEDWHTYIHINLMWNIWHCYKDISKTECHWVSAKNAYEN